MTDICIRISCLHTCSNKLVCHASKMNTLSASNIFQARLGNLTFPSLGKSNSRHCLPPHRNSISLIQPAYSSDNVLLSFRSEIDIPLTHFHLHLLPGPRDICTTHNCSAERTFPGTIADKCSWERQLHTPL